VIERKNESFMKKRKRMWEGRRRDVWGKERIG